LFIEEMTKAVLEAESQHAAERAIAAAPSPAVTVPASLHASLMARLDRLGPAKEVAQIGGVIGREFSHALLAAVVRKPDPELAFALDRLSALVQDAAYGTLLRERRRALHAQIAETLEGQFAEIAESQPELLARHCTEAGLIEKAAGLWGKAGQRSLDRSALVEGVEQLTRALAQIATLPATPALRREEIKLQVALMNTLLHVKGMAAPETKAAIDRARLLIEQAETLGEPPEDPLLLISVLWNFCVTHFVAFNGDVLRELAGQFLTLAEKQGATVPLMVGHRIMGATLAFTGEIAAALAHYDQSLALYDPAEHRPLAMRFATDTRVTVLCWRALDSWVLGYPEKAVADADHALKDAREIGQAATLMHALKFASVTHILCGSYATANTLLDELIVLADGKGAFYWKASGMMDQGSALALTGKASEAVQMLTCGITARRSTGATVYMPLYLSYLARAYAELGQFDDAWRSIGDAMTAVETTKETWCEAEVNRIAYDGDADTDEVLAEFSPDIDEHAPLRSQGVL
jgi:predicted ATPase